MTAEQNKATVRRFFEAFAADDHVALSDVLAPDLVAYSHGNPDPQNRATHLQGIHMWNAAFGATHFTIEDQIAEGDQVVTRVTMRAIHNRGAFQGLAPSGKQIESSAVTFERIKGDKIVERSVISDWSSMMQQLGLPQPQASQ